MAATTYRDLLAHHTRGGFAWTRVVSQRLGAVLAVRAIRRGTPPATITVLSLVVGLAASLAALVLASEVRWLAGVTAFLGWQLAYGFDCADGQVARATGTTSLAGARLDVTVDFATKLGMAAAIAPSVLAAGVPVAAVVAASIAWVFPLFDEVSGRDGDADVASVDRSSLAYRTVGLVRDGGAQKGVAAVALGIGPVASAVVLLGLGVFWSLALVARVVVLVRRSSAG